MPERGGPDGSHLSIGEVLSLLQDEFPDVTISKIRFLESQGLIDPERTPSGYRKFYDGDIRRLSWILRQQREHFLPLKVIKSRLEAGFPPEHGTDETDAEPAEGAVGDHAEASARVAALQEAPSPRHGSTSSPRPGAAAPDAGPPAEPDAPGGALGAAGGAAAPESYSAEELLLAAGIDAAALHDLEEFGLVVAGRVGGSVYYDHVAVAVAGLAGRYREMGVEPRHLRMVKVAVEREMALYDQLISPLLKQRNPQSRRQAAATLDDLVRLGGELRSALARQAIRGQQMG